MFCTTFSCHPHSIRTWNCQLWLPPSFAFICNYEFCILQVARNGAPPLQNVAASRSRLTVAGPKTPNICSKRKSFGKPAHKVYPTGWQNSDALTSHEVILLSTAKHKIVISDEDQRGHFTLGSCRYSMRQQSSIRACIPFAGRLRIIGILEKSLGAVYALSNAIMWLVMLGVVDPHLQAFMLCNLTRDSMCRKKGVRHIVVLAIIHDLFEVWETICNIKFCSVHILLSLIELSLTANLPDLQVILIISFFIMSWCRSLDSSPSL